VTLAAVIYDLLSVKMAGLYVVAQLIGAYIGFGLLKLVTPVC
jgi:aquaporin rerated protein, invertebrate